MQNSSTDLSDSSDLNHYSKKRKTVKPADRLDIS